MTPTGALQSSLLDACRSPSHRVAALHVNTCRCHASTLWPCVAHLTHSCGTIHIPAALSLPPYQRGDRDNKFLFSKSKSEFEVLIIKSEV